MPVSGKVEERIGIPDGVDVTVEGDDVTVSSQGSTVERRFAHPLVSVVKDGDEIVVLCGYPKKKEAALVGTFASHIRNMILGMAKGFECTMRIVYSHFPMKVSVNEERKIVLIENFLGERHHRTARIMGETEVSIKGDTVILKGNNKEDVGQSAANIEQATKIRGFDPRVFQDGVYVTEKPRVQENE
ncbi:MAG: 50S ribosomal protein L6 [Thermoplasmata archaeon]